MKRSTMRAKWKKINMERNDHMRRENGKERKRSKDKERSSFAQMIGKKIRK